MYSKFTTNQKVYLSIVAYLVCTAVVVLLTPSASATAIVVDSVTCPVCHNIFWDRKTARVRFFSIAVPELDFTTRLAGADSMCYYPLVCPRCLYAGYPDDFDSSVVFTNSEVLALRDSLIRPMDLKAAVPIGLAPLETKYELVLQTMRVLKRSPIEQAWTALCGSWARRSRAGRRPTRVDDIWPCAVPTQSAMYNKLTAVIPKEECRFVFMARALVRSLPDFPDSERLCARLTALVYFREHGENPEVLALLPQIQSELPPEIFDPLADSIRAIIEQERYFQRIALRKLEEVIVTRDGPAATDAVTLYMCGELCRRLDRPSDALSYYKDAKIQVNPDDPLNKLIDMQQKLVE